MRNGELYVETIGGNQGGRAEQGGGVTKGFVKASSFTSYRRAPDANQPATGVPPQQGAPAGPNAPGATNYRAQLQEQLRQIGVNENIRTIVKEELTRQGIIGAQPRGKLDEDLDKAAGKGVKPLPITRDTESKADEDLEPAAGKGTRRQPREGVDTKPDEDLDVAAGKGRQLDKAAGKRVDVNGSGKITVDVKNNVPIPKPRPSDLAKPVAISRQQQMTPAAPTGGGVHMEE